MNERDRTIVEKIIKYCEEVEQSHTFFQKDKTLFLDKEKGFIYRNAITMPILQIGELANKLTDDFTKENKQLPWKAIIGTRHIYVHHYGTVDYELVWNTSTDDIPSLKETLLQLIDSDNDNPS